MSSSRVVEFVRLLPDARAPKRADRSASGLLPARAMRYCEALTSATGFGYWFFPPLDLDLLWDGEEVFWSFSDTDEWFPLSGTSSASIQHPGFSEAFDHLVPPSMKGMSPPLLTSMPENGIIQIWTGFLAKTRPGWSLLVKAPVNLKPIPGLFTWEGIVETDLWFGPLFNNFRFTKTDTPVKLRSNTPFIQVQPIPQAAYRDDTLADFSVQEASELTAEEWQRLERVLQTDPDPEARMGLYAVTIRKRPTPPPD